jgi:hypothetical protein
LVDASDPSLETGSCSTVPGAVAPEGQLNIAAKKIVDESRQRVVPADAVEDAGNGLDVSAFEHGGRPGAMRLRVNAKAFPFTRSSIQRNPDRKLDAACVANKSLHETER